MEEGLDIQSHTDIESAPIVIYVPGMEQTTSDFQIVATTPKKPRALVYQFFEWEPEYNF